MSISIVGCEYKTVRQLRGDPREPVISQLEAHATREGWDPHGAWFCKTCQAEFEFDDLGIGLDGQIVGLPVHVPGPCTLCGWDVVRPVSALTSGSDAESDSNSV
jgi:hypothetical protein